jgi:glycosyltransferase involved in cell wall biosynthesis
MAEINNNVLFSVIVPVYNVENYLKQCLDSILIQDFKNFELILVNDGSTDSSSIICTAYEARDTRISVIHKENGGLSEARNIGLLRAKGDYIIFTDSDDYWEGHQVLEDLNCLINESNPDLIIHEESRFFSKKNVEYKDNRRYIKNKTGDFKKEACLLVYYDLFVACAWDKIVRRTILIENNLFFPLGRKSEDIEWCSRLINHIETYTIYSKSFYLYRKLREGSITNSVSENHIMDIHFMLKQGLSNESDLSKALKNYWAFIYVVLLKDFYVLSSRKRKIIWDDLVSWKFLLKEGRNIRVDQVMKYYNFLPLIMLPVVFYIYRVFNVLHKKYKTL